MSEEPGLCVRETALAAIMRTEAGTHIQAALDSCLRRTAFSAHDCQLCTDLVYGYFRARARLEFILGAALAKPQKLPEKMRLIMCLCVYAFIFQTKIPAYAAVDLAVRHVKKLFGQRMANVANGALRSLARIKEQLLDISWYVENSGVKDRRDWHALCLFYGMPLEIAEFWRRAYGRENAVRLMRRSASRPWSGIYLNASHDMAGKLASQLAVMGKRHMRRFDEFAFALAPGHLPENIFGKSLRDWHEEGALSFIAPGSVRILQKLNILSWDAPVWDCCAGVGGKSVLMAGHGLNIYMCSDASISRLRHLPTDFRRLKASSPRAFAADALFPPVREWNGNILADAPCSGLGVMARRPDIRKIARNLNAILKSHASKQYDMVCRLCSLLKPGHEFAYITCTLNPDENEGLIARILKICPRLRLDRQWHTPHGHPWLEGMFGAVLRKP